jgi:hypothetical protein
MPRKALPAPAPKAAELPTKSPKKFHDEQQLVEKHHAHLGKVDQMFGLDGMPYDRYAYIARAQGIRSVIGSQVYELGRVLIVLREHEPDGEFHKALETIGVAPRFAQKCMKTVVKFEGSEGGQMLAARLSQTKLLELLSEDDESIDMLAKGGLLAGMNLDDVERMTLRELRGALRKERKERGDERVSFEQQIERKDKKLNALDRKAKLLAKTETRERVEALLGELDDLVLQANDVNTQVFEAAGAIRDAYDQAGEGVEPDVALRIQQAGELIRAQLQQAERTLA